jgi:hypothetical protein
LIFEKLRLIEIDAARSANRRTLTRRIGWRKLSFKLRAAHLSGMNASLMQTHSVVQPGEWHGC